MRESAADVIVLDISMLRVGGLQALVPLRSALPQLGSSSCRVEAGS